MARQGLAWRRSRDTFLVEGGFPPLAGLNPEDKEIWFRDYTSTYVAPLVSENFRLRDIGAFETFARLALMRTSQTVNLNALAPLVGVSLHASIVCRHPGCHDGDGSFGTVFKKKFLANGSLNTRNGTLRTPVWLGTSWGSIPMLQARSLNRGPWGRFMNGL